MRGEKGKREEWRAAKGVFVEALGDMMETVTLY